MIDDRVRAALKSDIAAKLLAGGRKGWREIQSRYPEVSSATFFRLVGEVKSERAPAPEKVSAAPDSKGEIIGGGISQPVSNWPSERSGQPLSLPPEQLIAEIASLFVDANMLRRYALDSHGEIRFPDAFAQSAKLRERAIKVAVVMLLEIYNANSYADMLDALVQATVEADAAVSKQIVVAMREIMTRNFTPKPKIQRNSSNNHESAAEWLGER